MTHDTSDAAVALPESLAKRAASCPLSAALLTIYPELVARTLGWIDAEWQSYVKQYGRVAPWRRDQYSAQPFASPETLVVLPERSHYSEWYLQMARHSCETCAQRVYISATDPQYPQPVAAWRYDAKRARKNAESVAERDALAWVSKLARKLAGATEYVRHGSNPDAFALSARIDGVLIEVRQSVVTKRAPRTHRLFNQFPARIYVQGKFTPEARLADAVAAAKQRKEIA